MNSKDFIEFTVLVRSRYPNNINPMFNTKEKQLITELLKERMFVSNFYSLPENIKIKIGLVYGSETKYRKQYIQNAINDYPAKEYCEVCGVKKKTLSGSGCSTECGNKLKNGSFIPKKEINTAIKIYGKNPEFSNTEVETLKQHIANIGQVKNAHGLRTRVKASNKELDEKLLAIAGVNRRALARPC